MAGLFKAPTSNFWSNSLNGAINDSVQTITLNSTSGLQSPGYIVIDRENGSGTATPAAREVVKYTGISSNDLTGCTRGADNSTARSHVDGALVEPIYTIGMHNDQRDAINAEHATDGTHSIIANATVTMSNLVNTVISTATVTTLTMVGGASVAPTVEGQINWRTGDNTLMVGDGSATALANLGTFKTWTPTFGGFSANPTNSTCRYAQVGKLIHAYISTSTGTSNSTSFTVTAPTTSANTVAQIGYGQGTDNGTYAKSVLASIPANSNTISLTWDGGQSAWTGSGIKAATFGLTYETA